MDPLSQGVAGATLAGAFAPKGLKRKALVAGFCGGMTADLDVLIRSDTDPLLTLQYHRHFTHALAFIPIGGALTALVLSLLPWLRRGLGWGRLFLFTTLGYATSGVVDACTSYGTYLYWPFSDARVAWNTLPIIDLVYTGLLLVFLCLSFINRRALFGWLGLAVGIGYPLLGEWQHRKAEAVIREVAAERGHAGVSRLTAKPAPLSLLLWRTVYLHGDRYFVDALHVPFRGEARLYPGDSTPAQEFPEDFPELRRDSRLYHDLARFDHFSDGYLYMPEGMRHFVGDLRYAMIPNSLEPLWGVRWAPGAHDAAVTFETFRTVDETRRQRFLDMLLGQ
jgi:inner membrane protein